MWFTRNVSYLIFSTLEITLHKIIFNKNATYWKIVLTLIRPIILFS